MRVATRAGPVRLHPLAFAALIVAVYVALALPISRDLSFVVAGDYFVDAHALPAPIFVRPHSFGYDGQFFYRMAVAPFSFANPAAGILFDVPVYRSQRFLFPLIAWLASGGQPAAAATAMFAINLAGIGLIAATALGLVRRLALPDATAWAIVAWPGLLVTLTHDTSEIVAVALLLAALWARVAAAPLALYVVLGAAAPLARETTAPVFAGLFLWDLLSLRRGGSWRLVLADALTVAPVLALHAIMPVLWQQTVSEGVLAHVFGWPLLGPARAVVEKIAALVDAVPGHGRRAFAALNLVTLLLLVALAARAVMAAFRVRGTPVAWIAAAWLPPALLMAGLNKGDGALISPTEYCRVFSEFWPLSCLLIAAASPARRAPILLAAGLAASVLAFTYGSFGIVPV